MGCRTETRLAQVRNPKSETRKKPERNPNSEIRIALFDLACSKQNAPPFSLRPFQNSFQLSDFSRIPRISRFPSAPFVLVWPGWDFRTSDFILPTERTRIAHIALIEVDVLLRKISRV